MRLLLVEDDQDLAEWLVRLLEQRGMIAEWEEDGLRALTRAADGGYDAIILDLGLPGLGGAALLSRLRAGGDTTPVIVATARHELPERVALLHAGADDFLTKPFAVEELEARLVALVRRSRGHGHGVYDCGPLVFNHPAQRFTLDGQPLLLTPREHAVLRILIQRVGEPISKQEILDRLVNADADMQLEAVEVMIYRLRKRLEGAGVGIVTLRGLGYFLETRADD